MIAYENLAAVNASFFEEFSASFDRVLKSGWYILGSSVGDFEKEFAAYNGAAHCVGVASGLDAITLSLNALGLEKGSEVIVPSNTYIATIISVLQNGLVPVAAEPFPDTYTIDPEQIEAAITPKTKAVIVVHLYGKSGDMDPVADICRRHGLRLIEDCAQSHGARYKNRNTGTFGDFGAFSFYPTKNLGALGDAGGVLCSDERLAAVVRKLRNYGSEKKYYNEMVGYNSRLDEMQAAFLSVKLRRLDDINRHKRMLAEVYLKELKSDFIRPVVHPDYFDVYHIFPVRHPRRDDLHEHLRKSGIGTEIHYPVAPHRQDAMQGVLTGSYPISEAIHDTILSLPISFCHSEDDICRVVEVMNAF